jgi:hypothetical protein
MAWRLAAASAPDSSPLRPLWRCFCLDRRDAGQPPVIRLKSIHYDHFGMSSADVGQPRTGAPTGSPLHSCAHLEGPRRWAATGIRLAVHYHYVIHLEGRGRWAAAPVLQTGSPLRPLWHIILNTLVQPRLRLAVYYDHYGHTSWGARSWATTQLLRLVVHWPLWYLAGAGTLGMRCSDWQSARPLWRPTWVARRWAVLRAQTNDPLRPLWRAHILMGENDWATYAGHSDWLSPTRPLWHRSWGAGRWADWSVISWRSSQDHYGYVLRGEDITCSARTGSPLRPVSHILRGLTFGNRTWCSDWRSIKDHYGVAHLEGRDVGKPHQCSKLISTHYGHVWHTSLTVIRKLGNRTLRLAVLFSVFKYYKGVLHLQVRAFF